MAKQTTNVKRSSLVIRIFLGLLVVLLLAVALMPSIVSTHWGKDWLLSSVNKQINGTLMVERLQLGWFTKQTVQGLKLYDREGNVVLAVDKVTSDKTPLALLSSPPHLGKVEVVGLKAHLIEKESGLTSLQTVFHADSSKPKSRQEHVSTQEPIAIPLPFLGNLIVKDASISWTGSQIKALAITNINAQLNIPSIAKPAQIHLEGVSQQGELKGEFVLNAQLSGFDAQQRIVLHLDQDGVFLPQAPGEIAVNVKVSNLGLDVIDRLATFGRPELRGVVTAALGDRLNFQLDQKLSHENAIITLLAESPRLKAELVTEMRDGKMALQKPGRLTFAVSPALANYFAPRNSQGEAVVRLARDANLDVVLDQLNISDTSSLRLQLKLNGAELASDTLAGPILIDRCEGYVERSGADEALAVDVNAQASYQGESGQFALKGKWLENSSTVTPWWYQGDFVFTAERLPSAVFDALLATSGLITDIVGHNIDVAATLHGDGKQTHAEVKIGSDQVSIPSLSLDIGSAVTLSQPAQLNTQVSRAAFQRVMGAQSTLSLAENVPVLATLKNLYWPLNESEKSVASMDLEVSSAPWMLENVLAADQGKLRISNLRISLKASSLSQASYALAANIAPDSSPVLKAVLGSVSSLQLSGQLSSDKRNPAVKHVIHGAFHNELLDLAFKGKINPEGEFVLASPLQARYQLNPAIVAALTGSAPGMPKLLQSAAFDVTVERLKLPLKGSMNHAVVEGSLRSKGMAFGDQSEEPIAGLNDIDLGWSFDGRKQEMTMQLTGKTAVGSVADSGKLSAYATVADWTRDGQFSMNSAKVEAHGNLAQLPIGVFANLAGHPEWALVMGDTLDVRFNADVNPTAEGQQGNIDLALTGKSFEGGASFEVGDKLRLKPGIDSLTLQWTMTPERFAKLHEILFPLDRARSIVWKLADSSKIVLKATDLSLPWKELDASAISLLAAKVDVTIDGLQFTDTATKEVTVFDTVNLQLNTTALGDRLNYQLLAKESIANAQTLLSQISVMGSVNHAFANGKWFDPAQMGISVDANVRHIPLALFLENSYVSAQLSTYLPLVFGRKVDGTARASLRALQGPLSANLTGANGNFTFVGQIKDDRLTLSQPMTLAFKLTPSIATTVMGEVMPILSTALGSDQPITLTIDSNNFSLPVKDFTMAALQIGKATVSLGRVSFRQEGQMGSIVSLLNFLQPGTLETFNVWFTPIYFSINKGQVKLERLDALIAERYPIAVWGRVDLIQNRVNMVVGISGQALREAYGIRNLGDDYMLQLALRGSTSNASIDKARAATRITSLIAQSQGDAPGLILSGVMDLIGGGTGDGKVPAPTTNPLPWGGAPSQSTAERHSEKSNTAVDKVQKQIEKGAEKLLDWLR